MDINGCTNGQKAYRKNQNKRRTTFLEGRNKRRALLLADVGDHNKRHDNISSVDPAIKQFLYVGLFEFCFADCWSIM